MNQDPAPASCSICADEGIEAEILDVTVEGREGRVRSAKGVEQVALDLIDSPRPGDRVIVHLGFAIARILEPRA